MSKSGKLVGVCNGIWHCGLTDCFTEHDLACEHSQPTQQKCQCSYLPIPHEHSTTQQENNMSKTKKCHCQLDCVEPCLVEWKDTPECIASSIQIAQQKDAGSWEKDFDKWFGHREGKKLRFAYATGVFEEVKAFIREVETQARQQAFTEALEAAPKEIGKVKIGPSPDPIDAAMDVYKALGFNQAIDEYRANIEKRMKQ